MDEELYRINDMRITLQGINPHLELKEFRKNLSNFTLDLILGLAGHETKVEVPMDRFRDFDRGGKEAVEESLQQGYVLLLRCLEKEKT